MLYPDCRPFLDMLLGRNILILMSTAELNTSSYIHTIGMRHYFAHIITGDKKTLATFISLKQKYPNRDYWAIGDRVDSEIMLGNTAGYKTIRIVRGKFHNAIPATLLEQPLFEIKTLTEAITIIDSPLA